MAGVPATVVSSQGTAYNLTSMKLRAHLVFQPEYLSWSCPDRNSSGSFLGVYLVSISNEHQADSAGLARPNRIALRGSTDAFAEAFR